MGIGIGVGVGSGGSGGDGGGSALPSFPLPNPGVWLSAPRTTSSGDGNGQDAGTYFLPFWVAVPISIDQMCYYSIASQFAAPNVTMGVYSAQENPTDGTYMPKDLLATTAQIVGDTGYALNTAPLTEPLELEPGALYFLAIKASDLLFSMHLRSIDLYGQTSVIGARAVQTSGIGNEGALIYSDALDVHTPLRASYAVTDFVYDDATAVITSHHVQAVPALGVRVAQV